MANKTIETVQRIMDPEGIKNNFIEDTVDYFHDEYNFIRIVRQTIVQLCMESLKDKAITEQQRNFLICTLAEINRSSYDATTAMFANNKSDNPLVVNQGSNNKTIIVSNYDAIEQEVLQEIEAPRKRERVVVEESE